MFSAIALKLMVLALIYTIIQILCKPSSSVVLIPSDIVLFIVNMFFVYSCSVNQQLFTYSGWNCVELFIIMVAYSMYNMEDMDKSDTISMSLGGLMIVASFVTFCGIGVHSEYATKPSARSISVTKMADSKIPSLNKHDTPEPLAPKTVFQEISNNWSHVPNPNAYSIARRDGDITNDSSSDKEIQAQYVGKKKVYVVPLQFNSYSKYRYYKTIPGYWLVSATNSNDIRFVHKTIRYSDSSYFGHNTNRLMYKSHPDAVEMSKNAQLEVDKHLNPYYVETLRKSNDFTNKPNFHHLEVSDVDASNGKVHFYRNMKKAPKFLDETITSDVAYNIAKIFGTQRGGYWNIHRFLFLGNHQHNVMRPTKNGPEDNMTTIFHKGHVEYETDMTTHGNGTSALGVLTVNGRSPHVKLYKSSGMNDSESAQEQAHKFFDKDPDWKALMPIPYDVNGVPTWITTMTDSDGRIQYYFYQDAHNNNYHAYGTTPSSALASYKVALAGHTGSNHDSSASKTSTVKGTVNRVIASPDKVVFTLNGSKKYYVCDDTSSVLMHSGDKVDFKANYHGVGHTAKDLMDNAID